MLKSSRAEGLSPRTAARCRLSTHLMAHPGTSLAEELASGFLHRTLAMEVPFKKERGADSFWQIWLKQRKSSVPLVGRHCFCYPMMAETNCSGYW